MTDAGFPYLSILTALPLVGALVVALVPRTMPALAKQLALLFSLAVLGLGVATWLAFDPNGSRFQLRESYPWIPTWDVRFTFATDGISLVMLGADRGVRAAGHPLLLARDAGRRPASRPSVRRTRTSRCCSRSSPR